MRCTAKYRWAAAFWLFALPACGWFSDAPVDAVGDEPDAAEDTVEPDDGESADEAEPEAEPEDGEPLDEAPEVMPPSCNEAGGACCTVGELCTGGGWVASSDCGVSCCAGGVCRPGDIPLYPVAHVVSPVVLDGRPDEFLFTSAIELQVIETEAIGDYWLLWDEEALHVAAMVSDSYLNAFSTGPDGDLFSDDSLEISFDTANDRGAGELPNEDDYKFFVNVRNIHRDDKGAGFWGDAWNAEWSSEVDPGGTINVNSDLDEGYALELSIPWGAWGIAPPRAGDVWGLEVTLNDTLSVTERYGAEWANLTGGTNNDPDGWGQLVFVDAP